MAAQATGEVQQRGFGFHSPQTFAADVSIDGRLTTIPRTELGVTTVIASGVVNYTYFTARRSVRGINRVSTYTSVVSATITTQMQALYEEASNGNLTRVAVTANTTGAWDGADTADDIAFTSAVNLKAGQRYALATLFVGTTGPTLLGSPAVGATVDAMTAAIWGRAPKLSAQFAAQTDLVASVTNAQAAAYTATPIRVYAELWAA
jgi:hypothetical protein